MKRSIALLLTLVLMLGMAACGGKKSESVLEVENLINSIGEISEENFEDSSALISHAKDAYDELSSDEKESVENYSSLKEAMDKQRLVEKEIEEKLYQDELYALANELLKISYSCRDITSAIIAIWKQYGASNFSIGYNALRVFKWDWTKAEYDTNLKTNISNTLYTMAELLWPSKVQNKKSLTADEEEEIIDLLFDLNSKFAYLENNMNSVSESVRQFRAKYKELHSDEVTTLNDWCIECNMYVDFALNPSGNLNSYTSTREAYQSSMSKYAKIMDAYY